jgi:ABC-type microcin C transport system permease subunit YejE
MRNGQEITPSTEEAWHRRQWNNINRPRSGCGCLWILLALFIIGMIITLITVLGYSGYNYL